jgi:hypothetical protein
MRAVGISLAALDADLAWPSCGCATTCTAGIISGNLNNDRINLAWRTYRNFNFRIADPTKRLENVLAYVILSIGILHGFLTNPAAIAVGVGLSYGR